MSSSDAMKALVGSFMLPKEEMLEVARKTEKLFIGIPREINYQENRVALVPESVHLLVNNGHQVVIQTNAGKAANYSDRDYSEAGAQIAHDAQEVYKADMIFKVAPPSLKEIEYMQYNQTLVSALQLTVQPKNFLKKLMEKKITAIAWDFIMDTEGIYPIVRAMGEIAGNTSILIAAEYLSNVNNGQGLMLGGITGVPPTEVVILGAGTVGEFATRAALGLGSNVKVFDNSIYKLRRLQNSLAQRLFTSTLDPTTLTKALMRADVVIGAIRSESGRTPCVVTEAMVEKMKPGAIIVDVSIDQGGCFETSEVTTHDTPIFNKHGVIHYCVPNIASRVSRTASKVLSNIIAPTIIETGERGGILNKLRNDKGVRHGVYIYKGTLTNAYLGESFNLPYKDIELLMAAL